MNDNLIIYLTEYRDHTKTLIEASKKEDYECIELHLKKRQDLIVKINLLSFTKHEFAEAAASLELSELENTFEKLLMEIKDKIKNNITDLNRTKAANKSYNRKFYTNAKIFSKKI